MSDVAEAGRIIAYQRGRRARVWRSRGSSPEFWVASVGDRVLDAPDHLTAMRYAQLLLRVRRHSERSVLA